MERTAEAGPGNSFAATVHWLGDRRCRDGDSVQAACGGSPGGLAVHSSVKLSTVRFVSLLQFHLIMFQIGRRGLWCEPCFVG